MSIPNNDHLLAVDPNSPDALDTPIHVGNLGDATIAAGGSGKVPAGYYKLGIKAAKFTKKKDKEGKNLNIEFRVESPEAFKGVPIVVFHPAPVGDQQETGHRQIHDLVVSIASGNGTLEALKAKGQATITPKFLVGKSLFARIEDGTGNYANRSDLKRYATKDEFEASPGPDRDTAMPSNQQQAAPDLAASQPGMPNGSMNQPSTTQKPVADAGMGW